MEALVEIVNFRLAWNLDRLHSRIDIDAVPLAASDHEVEGFSVRPTRELGVDDRWKNLQSSLMRLTDFLETQFADRTVRFGGTEVVERGRLLLLEGAWWALKPTFAVAPWRFRTDTILIRELPTAIQRLVSSINAEVRAIAEEEFSKVYGRDELSTSGDTTIRKVKHRVFVSYNNRDKAIARRLAEDLERQGVDVWFDEWEILAGDSVIGKIQDGLKGSNVFVMLLSAAFQGSNWCTEEFRNALTRAIETGEPKVIPIIREDIEIPPLVRDRRRIDLRRDDFYDTAIEELLNGIYGISARRVH